MAAKYWLKLYHEILYDPKMGQMRDRLWRRTIEMFLLAGELDDGGTLPPIKDMAWKLRVSPEELETEMVELQSIGILSVLDGVWFVTKFADRQSPVSDAERMKLYRERKQKQEYYESVTNRNADTEERRGDIDTEKIREDEDNDDNLSSEFGELEQAFIEASALPIFSGGQVKWVESFAKMHKAKATPGDITNAVNSLQEKNYMIVGPASILNAVNFEIGKRSSSKRKETKKSYKSGEFADWIIN